MEPTVKRPQMTKPDLAGAFTMPVRASMRPDPLRGAAAAWQVDGYHLVREHSRQLQATAERLNVSGECRQVKVL